MTATVAEGGPTGRAGTLRAWAGAPGPVTATTSARVMTSAPARFSSGRPFLLRSIRPSSPIQRAALTSVTTKPGSAAIASSVKATSRQSLSLKRCICASNCGDLRSPVFE